LFKARWGSIDNEMTIVVGAGLAGLTCAKVLAEAGRPCLLLEADKRPGGRVVSDHTSQGFTLDRGFQVLLDSYPVARRHLNFQALGGGAFRAGAMFVGEGQPRTLENPLRRPSAVFGALQAGVFPFADQLRLARLASLAMAGSTRFDDLSTEALLQRCGFSEEFFARFARPFFGGVLLDPALQTSARLFLGYLRRFVTGRALLPARGIGGIPEQLVSGLPLDSVRYGARVEELVCRESRAVAVRLADGGLFEATDIVLAIDEPAMCRLLGARNPRPARATAVHYFAAERAFYQGAWLCLPPRREKNPVLHAALLTNVVPEFAPPGSHLWSVTVFPDHPKAPDAEFVAAEVASWFGAASGVLRPLAFVEVPYAVPEQLPGFEQRVSPWGTLPAGIHLAGDASCGASIDAVMASGEAAAKKVISSGVPN
jgi:phytoene dehydrogenase-like protein